MNVLLSLLMMLFIAAAVFSFMMLYTGLRQSMAERIMGRIRRAKRWPYAFRAIFWVHVPRKLRNYFFLFWFSIAAELIVLAIQIATYKNA